jgi:hypothetical protein
LDPFRPIISIDKIVNISKADIGIATEEFVQLDDECGGFVETCLGSIAGANGIAPKARCKVVDVPEDVLGEVRNDHIDDATKRAREALGESRAWRRAAREETRGKGFEGRRAIPSRRERPPRDAPRIEERIGFCEDIVKVVR